MPDAFAKPPSLPRDRGAVETPLFVGAGVALAVFAATRMSSGALPALGCTLKRWTGIPCPGCGGTRCLAACGKLDIASAFSWNPLVALAAVALLGWSTLALAHPGLAHRAAKNLGAFFTGQRIATILALNWLYLCWALPR